MFFARLPESAAWNVIGPFTLVKVIGMGEVQLAVAPMIPPERVIMLVNVPSAFLEIPPEPAYSIPPVTFNAAVVPELNVPPPPNCREPAVIVPPDRLTVPAPPELV